MRDFINRPLKVFLCHSSGDKPIVRELHRQLAAEGWIDVWLDEMKLLPGQEWDMEIEKAVEDADIVIVCLSTRSVDKEGYVQKELRFVLNIADEKPEGSIFVIPLRLDDCIVPRRLRHWQWVDYFPKGQKNFAFQRLLESLKARGHRPGITSDQTGSPSQHAGIVESNIRQDDSKVNRSSSAEIPKEKRKKKDELKVPATSHSILPSPEKSSCGSTVQGVSDGKISLHQSPEEKKTEHQFIRQKIVAPATQSKRANKRFIDINTYLWIIIPILVLMWAASPVLKSWFSSLQGVDFTPRVVYFLTGHGERDIEQASDSSFTLVKATLESENYLVKPLNLNEENKIPEDASTIVIAGPLTPVSTSEVTLLQGYLASDGSLLVMEDPIPLTEFGDVADPLAKMLARDWGIVLNNDIVLDLSSPEPTVAAAAFYNATHTITRNRNNLATFFPFTRSLSIAGPVEGIMLETLIQTQEHSWGETDVETLAQGDANVGFDEAAEVQGPLVLAIAGERSVKSGRVIVFGTSSFVSNQSLTQYKDNSVLLLDSIDWLTNRKQ